MSADTRDTASDSDVRLVVALGEYQAALDLGLPFGRADFLARFPDIPYLGDALDALDALGQATDEPDLAAPTPEPTLADFELIREVGRGGMGVVFEARQRSLDRVVAVKVLTRAAALDDRARRRFLHEARAAALVEHSHVVPVYHVGEEHGVPFYVMPLISGRSLAARTPDAVGPLPPHDTPAYFEAIARLGADAARALAAAHDQGVIHRDVKPGNLLLDPAGKVWVTDFGLAVAPFADGLTRTGARPGTPRYMSPEQLIGPRDRLDGRTDVYSLGVTLYELVCRRPAFEADDETELVRQITQGAAPEPRQVNAAVPPDLETIILKAMARDLAERYPTARDLADDLSRFVEHRPVLARRPGVFQHARKWVRRNRRPVAAVATTLLAGLLIGLSVSAIVSRRAYDAERQARDEAETNRRLAIAAAAELGHASDEILAHAPGMQDRYLAILLKCRDALEPFADDESLPVGLRREVAWIYYRVAGAYYRVGRYPESEAAGRTLVERLTPLVDLAPDDPGLRKELATAHRHVGHCAAWRGDRTAALAAYRVALAHASVAYRAQPDAATAIVLYHEVRVHVADCEAELANDLRAALPVRREAIRASEKLRDRYPTGHPLSYMRLASYWGSFGRISEQIGDYAMAECAFLTAIGHDEHLAAHFSEQPPDVRENSIGVRGNLGLLMVRRGRLAAGAEHLRRCVREMDEYVGKYPAVVGPRPTLLQFSSNLAQVETLLGRTVEARAAGERVARLLRGANATPLPDSLARVWAFLPQAELRDRAFGEELLAQHGAKLSPWVRAVVLYRLGRLSEAETAADWSIAGGFIRAACLFKRGERDAAKVAFDASAARLAAEPLRDTDLLLLQREIADLLAAK